jgi:hypothetical protein
MISLAGFMSVQEAVYIYSRTSSALTIAIYYSVKHLDMSMLLLKLQNDAGTSPSP